MRGAAHRALLDQRNDAGFGNVYANDLPFVAGVNPYQPAATIDGLVDLVAIGTAMIRVNAAHGPINTTGRKWGTGDHWVHGAGRGRCPVCGATLSYRDADSTLAAIDHLVPGLSAAHPDGAKVDLARARKLIALHPAGSSRVLPQCEMIRRPASSRRRHHRDRRSRRHRPVLQQGIDAANGECEHRERGNVVGGDIAFEPARHQIRQCAGDTVPQRHLVSAAPDQVATGRSHVPVAEVEPPRRLGVSGEWGGHGERQLAREIDDDCPTLEIRHEQVAAIDVDTTGARCSPNGWLLGSGHGVRPEHSWATTVPSLVEMTTNAFDSGQAISAGDPPRSRGRAHTMASKDDGAGHAGVSPPTSTSPSASA